MKLLKKDKKKKGFTLIELIAVVAILLILAVILIPNVIGYMNKSKVSRLKSDAKVTLDVIKTVQSQEDDSTITTYSAAIAKDANIKPSPEPSTELKGLTETQLQALISDTSTDYSHYKSTYLTTPAPAPTPAAGGSGSIIGVGIYQ